ncbi:LOW QUALITY PROTEIN: Epimerase domain-containing protein [Cephalotus follicularis]|uniref:Epimerase domain-containing protein n=1 Tax=Cephalotus follicularis TaxID=3775 RepID=A0A1Q3D197_CEPFO|nr:LOW QUALITY PROTEIN: Epimerase domain-containing protein [Cephalotus follicularis]
MVLWRSYWKADHLVDSTNQVVDCLFFVLLPETPALVLCVVVLIIKIYVSTYIWYHSFADYGVGADDHGSTLVTRGEGPILRKGTGGRSYVSGIIAAVFGASGFLGRYLVQQLAKMGTQVVPFRGCEDSTRHLKLMGDLGQVVPMKYNPRDEDSVNAVMAKANAVINLIGREFETRNYSFEEVIHGMAQQLAMISIALKVSFSFTLFFYSSR